MMKKQITRNIALTPELDTLVQAKVDSGRYQTASEVVREGLRLLEERDQERALVLRQMQKEIETGWRQSERGEVLEGPAVFAEIRKMSRARRVKRGR